MKLLASLMLRRSLRWAAGSRRRRSSRPTRWSRRPPTRSSQNQEGQVSRSGTPRKLLEMVDAVVLPHFNFNRMTMLAVGRAWRDATPAQREQLVQQFRTLLVRTYSTALEQYSNQTIEVKPANVKPGDDGNEVRIADQPAGRSAHRMEYRMEKTPTGLEGLRCHRRRREHRDDLPLDVQRRDQQGRHRRPDQDAWPIKTAGCEARGAEKK